MPSGSRGGSSGGHFGRSSGSFGGGHFGRSSGSSFGGGHFGRSSGSSFGGHFGRSGNGGSSMRWRPHTTVVFGRSVYYGAGRACASSLLTIVLFYAVLAMLILGGLWFDAENKLSIIRDNYPHYAQMIQHAENNDLYQIEAIVDGFERYEDTNMYAIFYEFDGYDGYSLYFYTFEEAVELEQNGKVILAIDSVNTNINDYTDSVPMDHKEKLLAEDFSKDVEYQNWIFLRNVYMTITLIAGAIVVGSIVAKVVIPLTAKPATKEQEAESNGAKDLADTLAKAGINGWKCAYCGSLNNNEKTSCDGCGAGRQK